MKIKLIKEENKLIPYIDAQELLSQMETYEGLFNNKTDFTYFELKKAIYEIVYQDYEKSKSE